MNIQKNFFFFFFYLPPLHLDSSSAFHAGYFDGDGEAIPESIGCWLYVVQWDDEFEVKGALRGFGEEI